MTTDYEAQAQAFLDQFGLRFRAVQHGDRCPPWCGEDEKGCCHGDRYRVTISREGSGRLSFDFWNSVKDVQDGKEPTAYDVLACISGDIYTPEDFAEFCSEYGYDPDSRRAYQMFKRCDRFGKRLREFFDDEQREALGLIQ